MVLMTTEAEALAQYTIRLTPDRVAKLTAHIDRMKARVPKAVAAGLTTTAALIDLFDRGAMDAERVR